MQITHIMRTVILCATFLLPLGASAQTLNCAHPPTGTQKWRLYPANGAAQRVADSLRVKTCDGKAFKKVAKTLGVKINVVKMSGETAKKMLASQTAKDDKRIAAAIRKAKTDRSPAITQ